VPTSKGREGMGGEGRAEEGTREGREERRGPKREGEGPHDPLSWGPQCLNPAVHMS